MKRKRRDKGLTQTEDRDERANHDGRTAQLFRDNNTACETMSDDIIHIP